MSASRRGQLLSLPTLAALLLTMALAAAPHALRQPIWLITLVLFCGVWRYLIARRGEQLPPAWLRTLLTVATAVGIYGSHGALLGRDPGTALLLGMAALKLLEMRRRRDVHIVMYLGYFLAATQFLYDQSLPMILYLGATSWALTIMLIAAHQARPPATPWRYARQAGMLLLQALPVMLLLFVLFPRLAGPLWRLPDDARGATTGLSDTMSPGTITHLSQSDEVAFRVGFDGEPPLPQERYWRGPVLSSYDGRTWRQAAVTPTTPPVVEQRGATVRYSVQLEPHNRRWLFALDAPLTLPADARWGDGLLLEAVSPIYERRFYTLSSSPQYRLEADLTAAMRARYLNLPDGAHPKARALAEEWRRRGLSDQELLATAAEFFRSQAFVYTLTPPALPYDPVDQFLFDSRRGFCEHYASALTVLMRAAGVPARVVTGYLGGEMNPLSNYMIVRQSDAHAWTEVWLQDQGWTRIDATGFIAPHRIEHGLADALPAGEPVPFLARSGGLLKRLNLQWDAINTNWNRWVLGYGPELQQQLLSRVGLGRWQRMITALGISVAVILGLVALLLLRDRHRSDDPLVDSYARFCGKLARRGLTRASGEGPHTYAARVAAARPDLATQVESITALYSRLRYGAPGSSTQEVAELRRRVREFAP